MHDAAMVGAKLLGVVLCGGQSSRMGRDKSDLTHVSGTSFLRFSIERLLTICDAVAVSTSPAAASSLPPSVMRIEDPIAHRGPIVGVATCVAFARQNGYAGCLCTPVDMPDLIPEDLRRLRDAWQHSLDRAVCAIDSNSGRLEPLVAIFPSHLFASLAETAASEDRSLARWMTLQNVKTIPFTEGTLRNVNRPTDL